MLAFIISVFLFLDSGFGLAIVGFLKWFKNTQLGQRYRYLFKTFFMIYKKAHLLTFARSTFFLLKALLCQNFSQNLQNWLDTDYTT